MALGKWLHLSLVRLAQAEAIVGEGTIPEISRSVLTLPLT